MSEHERTPAAGPEAAFPPAPWPDTCTTEGLHPWLEPVRAFLGRWRGRGEGSYPTLAEGFAYEQEITFSHDGRPFLHYEARAWLVDEHGTPLRPSGRETGWWRVTPEGYMEALLAHPTGIAETYTGRVTGNTVEMATEAVVRTPVAKEVTAEHRRYVLADDGTLGYATQLAGVGQPLQHHLAATLRPYPLP
ncbi:FABP family protein [Streptomyces griseocarneus]|nr:FABP family protein [Streptomyces griseocarneus]